MPKMSDEQYELLQDTRSKAHTARSARSTRTHNGKSGCTFSHERMSKKEIKAMSGECKTYRMNEPMFWKEFKSMPTDLQIAYVKALRNTYNVPDKKLAEMFGTHHSELSKYFKTLGLGLGRGSGAKSKLWYGSEQETAFVTWCNRYTLRAKLEDLEARIDNMENDPVDEIEEDDEEMGTDELIAVNENADISVPEEPAEEEGCCCTTECVVPCCGEMTFEGNVDDILRTIRNLLGGKTVHLNVKWDVLEG